jgi:serine phosphatase RsbU (regulator of sigma subunit)
MSENIEKFLQQQQTFFDKKDRLDILKGQRLGSQVDMFVCRLYKERYESIIRLFADFAFSCSIDGKIKELHLSPDFKTKVSEFIFEEALQELLMAETQVLKIIKKTLLTHERDTLTLTIPIHDSSANFEIAFDYYDHETILAFAKNSSAPVVSPENQDSYMAELINSRLSEILQQKSTLEKENLKLSNINKDLLDSIAYARKIQRAIFPDPLEFQQVFHDSFILFSPRDMVSGDLYWFDNYEDTKVIAVVDCTGHGVPGAFISVLSYSLLNKILSEKNVMFKQPSELLSELHFELSRILNHEKKVSELSDGMDIGLCLINSQHNILYFSGAFHNLYHVSNGVLQIHKGDKLSVGGSNFGKKEIFRFTTTMIEYENDDVFYLTTDGYLDQFGGDQDKKFLNRRFRAMIEENFTQPMDIQQEIFRQQYDAWRGKYDQVDDVLVVGFRCSF